MALGLTSKGMRNVVILLCGAFLTMVNLTAISPALPSIMAEYSIGPTLSQWLVSGYGLVEALVIPFSAFLVGRFSTRRLFIGGYGVFLLGGAAVVWGPAFWVVMAGRILQALSTGVVMPMTITLLLVLFPHDKRGIGMGLSSLVLGIAPAIGPAVAGPLIDTLGWHMVFALTCALAAVLLVVSALLLTNVGSFERIGFDGPSVVLALVGLFCLLFALSNFTTSISKLLILAMAVVGIAFLTLFVRRQGRLEVPMLRLSILKTHRYAKGVAVAVSCQALVNSLNTVFPIYVQMARELSASISGFVTLPGALIGAILAMVVGGLYARTGARRLCIAGSALMMAGAIGMALLGTATPIALAAVVFLVICIGSQGILNPANLWAVNSLDDSLVQHASSFSNALSQVGMGFATALMVSLVNLGPMLAPGASTALQTGAGIQLAAIVYAVLFGVVLSLSIAFVRGHER